MRYLLVFLLCLPFVCFSQPYNPGEKVFIYLEGNQDDFIYQAGELLTSFDKKRGMFHFWLPLELVTPKDAAVGRNMIESVLAGSNNLAFKLSLRISDSKNLEKLNSPQNYAVDGLLEIAGEQLEVPVHITLMSSGNSLFYKLSFSPFLENLPIAYQQVLTGQLVFVVKQSVWSDFFSQ